MANRGSFTLQRQRKGFKPPKPIQIKQAILNRESKLDSSTIKIWNDTIQQFMHNNLSDQYPLLKFFLDINRTSFELVKFHFIDAHFIAAFVDDKDKPAFIKNKMAGLIEKIMKVISINEQDRLKFKNYLLQVLYRSCMKIDNIEDLLETFLKSQVILNAREQTAIERWDVLEWCFWVDAKKLCAQWGLRVDNKNRRAIATIAEKYIQPSMVHENSVRDSNYIALLVFNLGCLYYKVNYFDKDAFELLGLALKFIGILLVTRLFLSVVQTFKSNNAKIAFLKHFTERASVCLEREFIQDKIKTTPVECLTVNVDIKENPQALLLSNPDNTIKGMSSYSYLSRELKYTQQEIKQLKMARFSQDEKDSEKDRKVDFKDETVTSLAKPIDVNDERYLIYDGKKPIFIQLMQNAKVPQNMLQFLINSLEKGYIGSKKGPGICDSNEPGFFKKWRPNAKSGGRLYCPKETLNEDGSETWTFTRYFKNHKDKTVAKGIAPTLR